MAEPGVNRRRSGTRQDYFRWPDPPASDTERLGETGAHHDAQERPDPVAERAVREVQFECPDLRRRGVGVEAGAWRAECCREARRTRRVAGPAGSACVQFLDAAGRTSAGTGSTPPIGTCSSWTKRTTPAGAVPGVRRKKGRTRCSASCGSCRRNAAHCFC